MDLLLLQVFTTYSFFYNSLQFYFYTVFAAASPRGAVSLWFTVDEKKIEIYNLSIYHDKVLKTVDK